MTYDIPQSELNKLIHATRYDIQVRTSLVASGELQKGGYHEQMQEVHENNLKLLEDFLTTYGWPIPSIHGREAFKATWLICIHAIGHPKSMIKGRDAIEKLLSSGEKVGHKYACLYDRIALYTGGKQKYGTQFWPSKKGWYLKNLENADKVEEYRAAIGMEPLSKRWKEMENSTDESGYITKTEEERRDQEFYAWLIKCGWRKRDT